MSDYSKLVDYNNRPPEERLAFMESPYLKRYRIEKPRC